MKGCESVAGPAERHKVCVERVHQCRLKESAQSQHLTFAEDYDEYPIGHFWCAHRMDHALVADLCTLDRVQDHQPWHVQEAMNLDTPSRIMRPQGRTVASSTPFSGLTRLLLVPCLNDEVNNGVSRVDGKPSMPVLDPI